MQSMLNLRANHGVPLCLSGITNPLALSKEMADHERRRKAMIKRQISVHAIADQENRNIKVEEEEEDGEDLDHILYQLSLIYLHGLIAKAA